MVKDSLQKVKNHLDKFDVCIKERTFVCAINWRNWGVSHIKGAYEEEVIPFVENLRESFKLFEMGLYKEFIPKVVEKNDLTKTDTSHLHTNKVIEKCTKVLAPTLPKIESEPINAYFENNRAVHRDYLKVTKEHVETLQELLEQARALKPINENLDYACKFV
ncbi:hypothetical protein Tco_0152630 [Tanacetum coccineum]